MQPPPPSWQPGAPGTPQPQFPTQPQPPRPRPQYSRVSALFLSFFSSSLYRDVARNWLGIGLLYLLLVMLLTWIPVLVKGHVGMRRATQDPKFSALVDQLPSVTINKGVVSIKEPEPYIVRDPEDRRVLLYVDTTDKFDRPEAQQAVVLLGRSKVEVRQPNKTEVRDLSQVQYFYADRFVVRRWVDGFARWFSILALPVAMIGSLVWGLIRMLLYALIGLIFASVFNAKLDFAALMRLSAVAMTPGMVIDMITWLVGMPPMPCCGWSFIVGAITVGYLAFAVKANGQPAAPPGTQGFAYGFPTVSAPVQPQPPYTAPPPAPPYNPPPAPQA